MEENVEHHCADQVKREGDNWPRFDSRNRGKSEND